jgi:hypothetical protein
MVLLINWLCTLEFPFMSTSPMTCNDPVITAEPVKGNIPAPLNAKEAVTAVEAKEAVTALTALSAFDAKEAVPVNDPITEPEKDPVAMIVSRLPPLKASIVRVTCSA